MIFQTLTFLGVLLLPAHAIASSTQPILLNSNQFLSINSVNIELASTTPSVSPNLPVIATIQTKILNTFNDPRMVNVAYCESKWKQLIDGKPYMSPTSDVGIMQINQIHWKEAKSLGLDIFNSEDDNLKMGKIIYDREGIEAWMALKSKCYKNLSFKL